MQTKEYNQQLQNTVSQLLDEAKQQGATAAEAGWSLEKGLSITARLGEVETIENHQSVSIAAVKFDGDAFANVGGIEFESDPVPADAGLRIVASQRIVSFRELLYVVLEGQPDGPVMGQINRGPRTVIECEAAGLEKTASLLKSARPADAQTEVL